MPLYQHVLKSKRLDLGLTDNVIKVINQRHHSGSLYGVVITRKVGSDTVFQFF